MLAYDTQSLSLSDLQRRKEEWNRWIDRNLCRGAATRMMLMTAAERELAQAGERENDRDEADGRTRITLLVVDQDEIPGS